MSLRPFRLATILEAVKVAELRYLGRLRPWNTLTLARPAEAQPEHVW